jgi:hypothetical protein
MNPEEDTFNNFNGNLYNPKLRQTNISEYPDIEECDEEEVDGETADNPFQLDAELDQMI